MTSTSKRKGYNFSEKSINAKTYKKPLGCITKDGTLSQGCKTVYWHATKAHLSVIGQYYSDYKWTINGNQNLVPLPTDSAFVCRSTENTNPEVDQKMRCRKRTADAETDPRDESCRATPAISAETDSTVREVRMLRSQTHAIQERKDVKRKQKDPTEDDKGGNQNEPGRSELPSPPRQWISMRRLLNVENSLAFGMEMLPAFSKSSRSFSSYCSLPASHTASSSSSSSLSVSQTHKSRDQRHGPNLSFLPPIDKGLFALLQDAEFYCSMKAYTLAVGSLNTALQLTSKGHVLDDMQCADPEDINLTISYIQARLVLCYLRMKKPQQALKHAHRSVLTADWLYCLLGGTESHISTQLKLYWQCMLYKAQATEKDVSVMYTPYTGEPTDEDIKQAEEVFVKHHPTFTDFIYTDPRGGHVLPQTTDWLSAPAVTKRYLLTLGFRRREDGLFLKKMHSRIWPSFTGRKEKLLSPMQQKKTEEEETWKLRDAYEKILPVLDLMQTTQINVSETTDTQTAHSGVCAGSGLTEWLQYSSLLFKLGDHREHSTILQRCQAQLLTAPYLPQISPQQEITLGHMNHYKSISAHWLDVSGTGMKISSSHPPPRASCPSPQMHSPLAPTHRELLPTPPLFYVALKIAQEVNFHVGCLEDLIHSLGRKYLRKKARRQQCRKNTDKHFVKLPTQISDSTTSSVQIQKRSDDGKRQLANITHQYRTKSSCSPSPGRGQRVRFPRTEALKGHRSNKRTPTPPLPTLLFSPPYHLLLNEYAASSFANNHCRQWYTKERTKHLYILSRKFLDEAITGEEIGARPRCKATARGSERGEARAQQSFPALKHINTYSRNTTGETDPGVHLNIEAASSAAKEKSTKEEIPAFAGIIFLSIMTGDEFEKHNVAATFMLLRGSYMSTLEVVSPVDSPVSSSNRGLIQRDDETRKRRRGPATTFRSSGANTKDSYTRFQDDGLVLLASLWARLLIVKSLVIKKQRTGGLMYSSIVQLVRKYRLCFPFLPRLLLNTEHERDTRAGA
ncbi:hypothetical protein PAMA_001862 [Pampus argenteus]